MPSKRMKPADAANAPALIANHTLTPVAAPPPAIVNEFANHFVAGSTYFTNANTGKHFMRTPANDWYEQT
jgi:hypothetical protein